MVGQSRRRRSALPVSVDRRWDWLLGQVTSSFPQVPLENVRSFSSTDVVLSRVKEFLDGGEGDACALYFFVDKGNSTCLRVDTELPMNTKGNCIYAVKMEQRPVSKDAFGQEIIVGDLPATEALSHMTRVTQSVHSALLRAHVVEQGWGEVVSSQVMEAFNTLVSNTQVALGQVKGVTCLPLPSDSRVYAEDEARRPLGEPNDLHSQDKYPARNSPAEWSSVPGDIEAEENKIVHVLESALITWTKQMKNVIKQEPAEMCLTSSVEGRVTHHLGPLEELDFWEQKSSDLNGIFDQLQSDRVRKILRYLDRKMSTYSTPFAKLCKEAFLARSEANNTVRYLRPMRPWLQRLESEENLKNLPEIFRPVLHMLLLVWKTSGFYNTSTRLMVFMRKMCNALIARATMTLAGGESFRLIEEDQQREAVMLLQTAIKIMGNFKTAYFDYKAKAAIECPSRPWRVQNNAVFVRMDAFLERCHDVLELTQTTAQFQKLANLELGGGSKAAILTTSVAQIHADFGHSVAVVRGSADSDVMNLDDATAAFEENFQTFRTSIKSLERRLASVLNQAFQDSPTLRWRFRFLDCFSDIMQRPAIAEELHEQHTIMIQDFAAEVVSVMRASVRLLLCLKGKRGHHHHLSRAPSYASYELEP